jgi:hypothetical protein
MTKWQILFDAVNIGWIKNLCFFYSSAAFSIFGAQQVAPTRAPEQHLAGGSYFKTFGYRFSGFITSGTSHTVSFILRTREYLRIGRFKGKFWRSFERLSRQTTQLISKFNRNGIHLKIGAPIPTAQGRAHFGREEVVNRFMHPGRVSSFEHHKPIIRGNEGIDRAKVAQ